jgi:hypothetical protein
MEPRPISRNVAGAQAVLGTSRHLDRPQRCLFPWGYGNEYQGHKYTEIICAINVGWIAVLWAVLLRASRLRSFGSNLLFHATLFAWLAWYAFPYLGELP